MATYLPNVTDAFPDPVTYTPDFSFLDKMLKRREAMYEQGYAQVAGKFNYLNRELTNPLNRESRDKFMSEATKQLKDLSAMDLSLRQNVQTAASVFEPFYKNRAALGDMALTDHWNQQESIAESFRLKDGGKEFSEDNINYVRMQRNAFAQSDPGSWGSYYANKRSFNPYYNYYEEVQKVMKDFKPRSIITEQKGGLYINRVEDKSWYKEEVAQYLNGVLSDKAKQQMSIEAAVRLGSNPEALSSAYLQEAAQSLPAIDKRLDALNREISLEKDPVKLAELQDDLKYYQDKKEDINQNVTAIQSGDMSYIRNNSERLARLLYMGQKVNGFIDAYDHKDISQEIKFDQAALTVFREQQEWARAKFKEDRADKRAELDRKAKEEKDKELGMMIVSTPGENVTAPSKATLEGQVKNTERTLAGKHAELKDHIATVLGGGRTANNITEVEVAHYIKTNPGDKMVLEYTKMGLSLKNKKEELQLFDTNAEDYAIKTMGDSYQQLLAYRQAKKEVAQQNTAKVERDPKTGNYFQTIEYNGAKVKLDLGKNYYDAGPTGLSRASVNNKINEQSASRIASRNLGWSDKRGEELEQMYNNLKKAYKTDPQNTNYTVNRKGFQLQLADPRFKAAAGFLQQNSNIDVSKIMSITYVPTPKGMDIQIGYDPGSKENKLDVDAAANLMKTRFANNEVVVNKDLKVITIKGTGSQISPQLDPYNIVDPIYREELANLEQSRKGPGDKMDQAFVVQDQSGRNLMFRIRKTYGNTTEGDGYYLYGEGGSRPIINQKFDNALAPYKLMNELLREDPAALNVLLESKK